MISVLFVCMANICRSPALEACLKHLAAKSKNFELHVDSCGVGWSHLGQHPDSRMFEAAKKRGILIDHRAHEFQDLFFDQFDYILAVDEEILEQLKKRAQTTEQKEKIKLATEFSSKYPRKEIPDPYYMGHTGFDTTMDIVFDSCEGLFKHLKKHHKS